MGRKASSKPSRSRMKSDGALHDQSTLGEELIIEPADDLRIDKVMEIREAINNGEYDLDARVNELLGKFETNLNELAPTESEAPATEVPASEPESDTLDEPLSLDKPLSLDELDDDDNDTFQDQFESLDALEQDEDEDEEEY